MHGRFHSSCEFVAPFCSCLSGTWVLSLGNPFASFGFYGLLREMIDVCLADSAASRSSPILFPHLSSCSLLQLSIILLPFVPSTDESHPLVPCSHPISSFAFHNLSIVCAFLSRPRCLLHLYSIRLLLCSFPPSMLCP